MSKRKMLVTSRVLNKLPLFLFFSANREFKNCVFARIVLSSSMVRPAFKKSSFLIWSYKGSVFSDKNCLIFALYQKTSWGWMKSRWSTAVEIFCWCQNHIGFKPVWKNRPGDNWIYLFLKLLQAIILRERVNLEAVCSMKINLVNEATQFACIWSVMMKVNIQDPSRIFNLEESGI